MNHANLTQYNTHFPLQSAIEIDVLNTPHMLNKKGAIDLECVLTTLQKLRVS